MLKYFADEIKASLGLRILNQETLTELAVCAMFAGGHILIEGVPGLAKTLWVRALSKLIGADTKRVQFTSDLMPSDILGTKVFNQQTGQFELRRGPLFTQLFLADEINRTPPKTQSALLEVMEERAITIDGTRHKLQEPFFVMATQNPIEYEGTYPLPEALTDRFMMKLEISYPGARAEKQMLEMVNAGNEPTNLDNLTPIFTAEQIEEAKKQILQITVEDGIFNYIISLVETTRRIGALQFGASPRGSVALLQTSKILAAMQGRDFVIPDDVHRLARPVLAHRLMLKPEAEIEGVTSAKVIESILTQVKAPR